MQTTDADTEQYLSAEQEKITEFVESNSVETDGTSDQSFLSNELPFNENMFDDLIPEQLGDTIPSSTEVSAVSDTEEPTPSEASAVSAMEEPKPPGGETVSDTEEPTQSEASTVVTAEVPTPSDSDINAPAETILPTTVATGEDKEEASGVYQETEEETLPASLSEERSVNESDKSEPEKPTGFMPHFSHEGLGETEFPEVSATFQNRQDISDANPQESSNRERQGLSITEPQGSSNGVRRELHKEDLQRPSEAEGNNLSKVNPEWETTMSRKDKNSKGALSVLLKMMFLFFLIVATWFVLDSTGLLKGKTAVIKEENFAKGAKVIEDKNSPADKRVYPFNRDTQFEGYLKGSELKTGEYYEIAENGVLTAVPYDPAADKSMKVEVPPDSLIVENKKNKKQEDKQTEAENKAKDDKSGKNAKNDKKDEKPKKGDDQKPAAGGNITLQDAVKNKVNETKIADYVFKQGKNYFVQVSAHRAYKTAEKLAADLKKKGYKAFVMKINKEGVKGEEGIWYRVRIGPFDNQEKALSVNKEFQNKTKKK
ncbi:MAG: hypothetical protein B6D45_05115 [Ignavibacteriales bacterium UTCHB3]|nr:MAG: hypothetical protein B6D45_05115 [Ignavibacteriales bacterium UTCHB3]